MLISLLVRILTLIIVLSLQQSQSLQLCERGKDNHGRWVSSKDVDVDELAKHILVDTIKHGYSFERKQWISATLNTSESREAYHPLVTALHYSQVWIPENCSYHRFSNASLYRSVQVLQEIMHSAGKSSAQQAKPVQIVFMGDSALRGIFCGITRLLSGSEIYGPCINTVCGGLWNPARGALVQ
eukprot:gene29035-38081_t